MEFFSGRSRNFHESFNLSSFKQRREDHEVELRKNQRTEDAHNRRNLQEHREWLDLNLTFKPHYTLQDLPELLVAAGSTEDNELLRAAQGFRKLLSLSTDSPIQAAIDSGVVPLLTNWLQRTEFPQLQYEAA